MNRFQKNMLISRLACLLGLLLSFASGCNSKSPSSERDSGKKPSLTQAETEKAIKGFKSHFDNQEYKQASQLGSKLSDHGLDDGLPQMSLALAFFAAGDAGQSVRVFDKIVATYPESKPSLWQRGIALYYNQQFADGVDQFNSHQNFNSQDVENSVWQLMCQAKVTSVEDARKKMIPIERDRRIGMKEIFDMFAGTKTPEDVLAACGYEPGDEINKGSTLYHGFLYIGLYHEMMGETEKSREAIDQAIEARHLNDNFMCWIAQVHKDLRSKEKAE